ncbi:MAG: CinA family nicotinamide mononucleotide deamidase-related protein [Planctomycetota bacterium]|jgi:nicotinamide-nucleotide amidase
MTIKAEVLAIGDELVDGQALDTNSRWLADELALLGFQVDRFTVVRDDEAALQAAIVECCSRAGVVIATGGLGPTADDRTRQAAAKAAGCDLAFDAASWQHIQDRFARRGRRVHESNRQQAFLPASAQVIENRWGTAPGFAVAIGDAMFYALPGVPREMKHMFATGVVQHLRQHAGDEDEVRQEPLHFHNLYVLGCTEASLGERIKEFMHGDTRVGVTASSGLLTIRIAARSEAAAMATAAEIRPRLGRLLVCEGRDGLVSRVAQELIEQDVTCAVAESCTGGLLAAALTDVPGISEVFLAGVVTYDNSAKVRYLGVPAGLIEHHGAVSLEVAEAMARGVVFRTGAYMGVAITGIAGPGGGTEEKPVGTVCFGLAMGGDVVTHECRFGDLGRNFIRRRSVWEALAMMHRGLVSLQERQDA